MFGPATNCEKESITFLKEETFAVLSLFRESLFHKIFKIRQPAKVNSHKISKNKAKMYLVLLFAIYCNHIHFFLSVIHSDGKIQVSFAKVNFREMRKFYGSVGTRNFVPAKVSFCLYEQKEARKFAAMAKKLVCLRELSY